MSEAPAIAETAPRERVVVRLHGIVQGVGLRPFVHRLAVACSVAGSVRNAGGTVVVDAEGEPGAVRRFVAALHEDAPAAARIVSSDVARAVPSGARGFVIAASATTHAGNAAPFFLPPDLAPCADCERELADEGDRRHGYSFLNCTACGPRLTVVEAPPYDRARTTLARFAMCADCEAEYESPANRRFHAEPTACPRCGPRLALERDGREVAGDPIDATVAALDAGELVAVKGVGGYHLVCDAGNDDAVSRLRARKGRGSKPFAVLVADLDALDRIADAAPEERALVSSMPRPIVVFARRDGAAGIAPSVAPGTASLGVMLPYSPLHRVLAVRAGRPLVATSGNLSDEPLARERDEAVARLGRIADVFLHHDRDIVVAVDDSVARIVAGVPVLLRRSRGFAPSPIALPSATRPMLAVGAELKSTFALARDGQAIVSHHLGDLDGVASTDAFVRAVAHYERLFGVRPEVIAHDLHPDFTSTRYATERAALGGIQLVAVQHHHAHLAACLADARHSGPALGVVLDGFGLGEDGTAWGGELLFGDARSVERVGHLRAVAQPGGDAAVREPWRMAVAHLVDAGLEPARFLDGVASPELVSRVAALARGGGSHAPLTSSTGRLFDAVAALTRVCTHADHDGHAPSVLEWAAHGVTDTAAYPLPTASGELDTRPLVRAVAEDVARGVAPGIVSARFHGGLAHGLADACRTLAAKHGTRSVALTGGVFVNARLGALLAARLRADGLDVLTHRDVPPNDGGLSLGQLAVAAAGGA